MICKQHHNLLFQAASTNGSTHRLHTIYWHYLPFALARRSLRHLYLTSRYLISTVSATTSSTSYTIVDNFRHTPETYLSPHFNPRRAHNQNGASPPLHLWHRPLRFFKSPSTLLFCAAHRSSVYFTSGFIQSLACKDVHTFWCFQQLT